MWDLLAIEAGPTGESQCRLIRAKDVILLSTQDTQDTHWKALLPMSMHHLCLLTKLKVKIIEKT